VTLTILVAKEWNVTANHAIVQPSLQIDLPKILTSIVDVVGGPEPKPEELLELSNMAPENRPQRQAGETPPDMRPLLMPLIRKNASDEQVDQAAAEIEKRVSEDAAIKKEIARIATTIANSDKLENYGTPRTQFYLKKWAKEFGKAKNDPADGDTINEGSANKVPRR